MWNFCPVMSIRFMDHGDIRPSDILHLQAGMAPQDFMYLIDRLHQNGIGVILDWVPSHLPSDEHGLSILMVSTFTNMQTRRRVFTPNGKAIFSIVAETRSVIFLLAAPCSGLIFKCTHIDGLRVDAVASMLYLDYSRQEGEWIPNEYGGRENLESIRFLKKLNEAVYRAYPDVQTSAEESTSWPTVSRPTYVGGLDFVTEIEIGWMSDTWGLPTIRF